jgi:hypothetical protein
MSADFEVEMVLVGEVLLITRNLRLVTEFLTTSTDILARSVALGTRAIGLLQYYLAIAF